MQTAAVVAPLSDRANRLLTKVVPIVVTLSMRWGDTTIAVVNSVGIGSLLSSYPLLGIFIWAGIDSLYEEGKQMTDYSNYTVEELREAYDDLIEAGAKRGARGMSFGPQVMEGGAIKSELRSRGEEL